MAQGPWGTGTWDDARWDSLPLTGNQATGGVGSPSVAVSAALTGVTATGATGIAPDANTVQLSGVTATGSVGNVVATFPIVVQLTGVQATGSVGILTASVPIIFIDDTHDPGPDKLKKQLKREQDKNKKRRDEILAAYERIVEGKIPEEIIAPYVETFATIKTKQNVTLTDIDKMVSNLDKMQLIWDDHIESDDEEILLL